MLLAPEESEGCPDQFPPVDGKRLSMKTGHKSPDFTLPPTAMQHLGCESVAGVSGHVSNAIAWDAESGFFAYVADNLVIMENLRTQEQKYLTHHSQPLCGLALSTDGKLLATGSSGVEISKSADVCLWQADTGEMIAQMQYHPCAVQVRVFHHYFSQKYMHT